MAERITCTDMFILTSLLFLCIPSPIQCDYKNFAKTVAASISENITKTAKRITNYHNIRGEFETVFSGDFDDTTEQELNGYEVIRKFKQDIEGIFRDKTEALRSIKTKAEEEKQRHADNEKIKKFDYLNIRNIDRDDEVSLKIHSPFSTKVKVNMTHSFVQIPTNIYAFTPQILNTVKWTEQLDETFKQNYFNRSNETLRYQYYGDKSGLLRLYPGNKFSEPGESGNVDLFDCRRRIWYVQASASPKDVVIIIDMSGSMKGSNQGIARIAAASLIDTLTENDYFNVIKAKKKPSYVKPCAKHLIQATKVNKEAMKLAVQNLGKPEDQINPDAAIEKAFEILNSGAEGNRTTASCNKAIMFLSDGIEGESVAEAVFQKYNPNKTVRAFSFFIGRTHVNVGEKALMRMACDNRGKFYPIETVGNIWDTVLDYLQVMSRPLNASKSQQTVTYTPMYLDSGGLGMIMSISLGVFDQTGLIGVTGTDITLQSLLEKVPISRFGPFSHIFIINNNGFVVMHPKLKTQTGYLVSPRNVFLEDLLRGVNASRSMDLKKDMIDRGGSGARPFPMYWLYDDDQKVAHVNGNVFYEPIEGTDFSAGILLADNEVRHLEYGEKYANKWLKGGVEALQVPRDDEGEYHHVQISQWEYCKKPYDGTTSKSNTSYYTADELRKHLNVSGRIPVRIKDLPANCDPILLTKLLVTAAIVSKNVEKTWNKDLIDNDLYDGVFVATNAGYTKYYSSNKKSARYKGEYTITPHLDMAAVNPDATISVSAPYIAPNRKAAPPSNFTVTAAVKVDNKGKKILMAVSGVRIRSNYFQEVFDAANLATSDKYCLLNKTCVCTVIDKNGYIISSNQGERYVGRSVEEITGILMPMLVKEGVFRSVTLNDTQADCVQILDDSSDSRILLTPFKLLFQGTSALLQSVSWIVFQYATTLFSSMVDATKTKKPEKPDKKPPPTVSCTKEMHFYVLDDNELLRLDQDVSVECAGGCYMSYYIAPVKDTNLLFLMATFTPDCKSQCFPSPARVRHTKKSYADICKMGQHYRKPPTACFSEVVEDEHTQCGHAGMIRPSIWMLLFIFCARFYMHFAGMHIA